MHCMHVTAATCAIRRYGSGQPCYACWFSGRKYLTQKYTCIHQICNYDGGGARFSLYAVNCNAATPRSAFVDKRSALWKELGNILGGSVNDAQGLVNEVLPRHRIN